MKGFGLLLVAGSLATASGCAGQERRKPVPVYFEVTNTDLNAVEFANALGEAVRTEAYSRSDYRPAEPRERLFSEKHVVAVWVNIVRGSAKLNGGNKWTYIATWRTRDREIGSVADDCAANEMAICARNLVDAMTEQLWPRRR